MENFNKELHKHKKFRIDNKKISLLFFLLAVLVVVVVFWWLKLVGITITGDAFCGMKEHTHSEACYMMQPTCGLTEAEGAHLHTEECNQNVLICTLSEHTHTKECFPDTTADVETVSDWLATIEGVEITEDVSNNLVEIALSQLGYTESADNFEYDNSGIKRGYTRYGEWYGTPYGGWDTTFVSFCLHYSNVHEVDSLKSSGAETMRLAWKTRLLYSEAREYTAQRGDLVFIDTDKDGIADTVAIVLSYGDTELTVISGDSNDAVEIRQLAVDGQILGYGRTSELSYAKAMSEEQPSADAPEMQTFNISRPLTLGNTTDVDITYTSDLTDELVSVKIINHHEGKEMTEGSEFHIGEPYTFKLNFKEINTGASWIQFRADENGQLTYPLPSTVQCTNVNEWSSITAKTPNGDIRNVGRYCVDENNVLIVEFFDTSSGDDFVDLYTNVDFTVEFSAIIPATNPGEETRIEFNKDVNVTLIPDGGGMVDVQKTIGEYDSTDNTVEYTVRVEAAHGMIQDLVLRDDIGTIHRAIRDTIVVTDLKGNVLDPQPTIEDNPFSYYERGFQLTGFPDFATGEGFLITYKTQIDAENLNDDEVSLWNFVDATGRTYDGSVANDYAEAWRSQKIKKMKKEGKQAFITDPNGNIIPAIEWDIIIRKHDQNLQGTVIIDNLGEGLDFYRGKPITVSCYNEAGNFIEDVQIGWDQITVENNQMSFALPAGFSYVVNYYTTYDDLNEGEERTFSNKATAVINNNGVQTQEVAEGFVGVVGIVPHVNKKASGNDGQTVKFTITANVPAAIKNWGHFYLTDDLSTWNNGLGEFLYVENVPQELVITAKTQSGDEILFTPYDGGSPENTYILITPAEQAHGTTYYGFRILFNTAETTIESSKWLLDEDAELTISYRISFDAKTGTEWTGPLTGTKTLGDVMIEESLLSNQAFFNYAEKLSVEAPATYKYDPKIIKHASVNADGTIDYVVTFNNDDHDTDTGYLNAKTLSAYFNDIFDPKQEYVQGSLKVTCYPEGNNVVWLNKYKYTGKITGNEMHISSDMFVYDSTHPNHIYWADLYTYTNFEQFYSNISKGTFVFEYTLKLKDEYLYSTNHSEFELDNTAEVTWDTSGSSGEAKTHSVYRTGLLNKQMAYVEDQLNFTVYVNQQGLDMDAYSDTVVVEDTMSDTMSVYWSTLQLYYPDQNGNWVNFNSEGSLYTYTATFNQHTNQMIFYLPDELPVKIEYTTLITEKGLVEVNNTVTISGKEYVTDFTDGIFRIEGFSGSASGSMHQITLIKEDGHTNMPLPNVTFYLYGPMGDPNAKIPEGVASTITTEDGMILKYIASYTTGEHGTVFIKNQYLTEGGPYALVEREPPEGYIPMDKPTYFYFYQTDPDGIIQTVTTIIAVDNYHHSYVLPETGGAGEVSIGIIGIAVMALPIVYSIIRRKRERRLKNFLP